MEDSVFVGHAIGKNELLGLALFTFGVFVFVLFGVFIVVAFSTVKYI